MALSVFPELMDKIDPQDTDSSLRTIESYINYIVERVEFSLTNTFRTTTTLGSSAEAISLVLEDTVNKLSAVSSQLADAKTDITRLQDDVVGLVDNLSSFEPLLAGQSDGPAERVVFTAPGEGLPLKACAAEITPVQEGEGDPSPTNIRPISGWTGAQIHVSPTTSAADGKTYVVDWSAGAGTVYGGTLDVLTGTLTVDRRGYIFDGTENWSQIWSVPNRCFRLVVSGTQVRIRDDRASSHFANVSVTSGSTAVGYYAYNGTASAVYVQFRPNLTDIPDLSSWKAWLAAQHQAGTPLTCWHTIAVPKVFQFSPRMVTTLAGTNNIWADTGDVTVEHGAYLAALQSEIEKLQEGGT